MLHWLGSSTDEYIYNICHLWSCVSFHFAWCSCRVAVTWRVPLTEQELLNCTCVRTRFSVVVQYLAFCVVFCKSMLTLFPLVIALSVLLITTFAIFIFFSSLVHFSKHLASFDNYVFYLKCHFTKMSALAYSVFVFSQIYLISYMFLFVIVLGMVVLSSSILFYTSVCLWIYFYVRCFLKWNIKIQH